MIEAATGAAARPVWTVAGLIAAVAGLVDAGFGACTVRGEVSGFSRAASGHCYFNLKDPDGGAALRCAMFRRAAQLAAFSPKEGDAVELRGRLAVYEPRGELQFVVEAMLRSGAGALYERFLRLKAQLGAEGLFDPEIKRALPPFPRAVGVVTSLAGAALHDVATTLARRSPHVRVVVYPSLVQGAEAPRALCDAIATAARRNEVDVLIVCRGGGSLEDLWAFNEESVVRAIRAAPMPVVSGVGHETDVSLADLAADLRAPTPTAAAELVAPATAPALDLLAARDLALGRRVRATLEREAQRLDRLALRLARPSEGVARRGHRLDLLAQRLAAALRRDLAARRAASDAAAARAHAVLSRALARQAGRVESAAIRLAAVDPRRVLARGYALLSDPGGHPVTSVAQIAAGDALVAVLRDGQAEVDVRSITPAAATP
ncbi:MAG: exodeoxyribonuclease VII large subunit [Caldimonas sp.]